MVKLTVRGTIGSGSQIFRFSPFEGKSISLQIDQDVRPYIIGDVRGRPVKILPDKSVTERSSITINFTDDPDAPDFDSTIFSIFTGGSFFRRLVVAQPDLVGSDIEVKRGFVKEGFLDNDDPDISDFTLIFKGRLEEINFGKDNVVSIVAKDKLTFVDQKIPKAVSDNNLLNGAISDTATTITVDKGSEFTDPNKFPSKDFFPFILRLDPKGSFEDVIINSRNGNDFLVQANHAGQSENFSDDIWVKTNTIVTPNSSVGPFGGELRADTIAFNIDGSKVQQTSALPVASASFSFSIWLKGSSGAGTITIQIEDTGMNETGSLQVSLTENWKRFEIVKAFTGAASGTIDIRIIKIAGDTLDACIAWGAQLEQASSRGFYAATVTNQGVDAGRGAFLTTPSSFIDNTKVQEAISYIGQLNEDGVHPIVVLRDLINRGLQAVSEIDQVSFDAEFNFSSSLQFRRGKVVGLTDTTIIKSRNLLQFVKEIRQQALIDVWVSEAGKTKVRFSWRAPSPIEVSVSITDELNILEQQSDIQSNSQSRVTRIFVFFDLLVDSKGIPFSGDKPEHYNKQEILVDLGVEDFSGEKTRNIFSKWIFRTSEASALGSRTLSRFVRGSRIARWSLDLKDDLNVPVGDIISLDSIDTLIGSGDNAARGTSTWQITQNKDVRSAGKIEIEALEFRSKSFAFIAPEVEPPTGGGTFPDDFDDAIGNVHLGHADRIHGFIGASGTNLVGDPPNAQEGYFIL
ncbi:MAG: hypothetical protein IIC67_04535 [Thaumarchaeota archaeon]|nr:hypothetical protein [Nitrososphaerota archaeon]